MSRALSFALFFGVVTLVVAGSHWYIWARLVRDPALPDPWRGRATIALIALPIFLVAAMPLSRFLPRPFAKGLAIPAYVWMGIFFLMITLLLGADLLRLLVGATSRMAGGGPADPERRLLVARVLGGAVAAATTALGALAIRNGIREVAVRPLEVSLARLPRALDGTVIVQITDLHVGPTLGREFVADIVRRVNALEPDVVAITGDLVDGSVAKLAPEVAPLAGLRARHGVYFVTGNHDYYSGVDDWRRHVASLGVRVLSNERVTIGEGADAFDLAGIEDPTGEPDLDAALAGRDPSRELVLLAHQPRAIHDAARLGVGLQLSGHTHGGQLWPWHYAQYLQQPYLTGYVRHGDTQLYISNGTGFWGPPMRLAAPAEITKVILRSKA